MFWPHFLCFSIQRRVYFNKNAKLNHCFTQVILIIHNTVILWLNPLF